MAKGEDITTKFKVDISDLKKGISEANRQIRLANAQFKAASAGMDDWSKSSNGISAKLKQLASVLAAQNSKLKSYKDQLAAVEQAEQKNGKRADELKSKLQQLASQGVSKTSAEYKKYEKALNDVEKEQLANKSAADNLRITILNQQAAVNSTEKDIKKYNSVLDNLESEAEQAENAVDGLSNEMDSSQSATTKLSDGFTVMKGALASLVADGIRKAASALKDFAGSMITTAAEVKAETAQFEQTFGDMGGTAEAAVKRVADSTGILETRLKTTGAQIYAFARANGSDVPTAMGLMEEALQAAADNAAYYDRSLEDSAETLQSFLKGNYANDAALGVSATEFTRNAKATELFGKKYNDLTEIQKQQTLLKMVTDSQKVSGAFGQAARESDGWENVMGNLNEAWRQFKAQVGTPFLEALIPVIQQITTSFQEWVNSVDWNAFGQTIQNVANKIIAGFGWVIDNGPIIISTLSAIAAGFVAFKIVGVITSLVNAFKTFFTVLKTGQGVMAALNAVMAANPIGLIVTAIAALVAGFITLWNTSEGFRNFWIGLWDGIKNVISTVVNWIKENWQAMVLFLINPIAGLFKYFYDHFEGFRNVVDNVMNAVKGFFTSAWEGIKSVWSTVADWFNSNVIEPIKNFFQPLIDFFTTLFNVIKELAEGCWEAIKLIWSVVSTWFNENIITPVKDFFSGLWNGIKNAASTAWNGIKEVWNVVSGWFNNTVVQPVKDFFSGMWNGIKNSASKAWEGIKSVFSPVVNWFKDKFSKAWTAVKNVFSTGGKIFNGIKEGIVSAFKTVVNGIIKGINKVIAVPFNAINKILDKIKNVSIAGVKPFKNLISRFNVPQIPLLAKGGVLKKGQVGLLEGSGDEAVVPLHNNKKWIRAVADDMRRELQGGVASTTSNLANNNVNNFTQIINAPKSPSRIELYRDARNLLEYTKRRV